MPLVYRAPHQAGSALGSLPARSQRVWWASDTAAGQPDDVPARLAVWSVRQDLARLGADTTGWRQLAAEQYGVDLVAPYLDNEVIQPAWPSPPIRAAHRAATNRCWPRRSAGAGVLPGFVLARTTKGGFNARAARPGDAVRARHQPAPGTARPGESTSEFT